MMGKTIKDFSFEATEHGQIVLRMPGREYWLYLPVDRSEAHRLQKEICCALENTEHKKETNDAE
jgi:hypothetical protein